MDIIKILPLTTLLLMTQGLATEYKVTPIPSSSGIIFHNLGLAKISNEHFTLLSYINLTHIEEKVQVIKDFYSITLSTCHIAINDQLANECFNQMKYIQKKLETIQKSFNIITHKINVISRRKRRGLMNAVGTGIKWLFGNPDSDDAQFYSDSINSLINNEKQTEVLMQQQVNVISDTITNFNNSLTRMNENINILNKNLKSFNKFQQDMITSKNSFEVEIGLSNHIILLIEMTDELTNQLNEYVNDISLISNNIISYNILPPETLYSELHKISTKQDLPLPLSVENIFIFYKLLEMKSFINKGLLVLSFNVPIVTKGKYEIYEILSAPVPHHEDPMLFSYIEPSTPYIVISREKTNYFNLNTLDKCFETLPNNYLCRHLYTMRKTNNNNQCEIILFNERVDVIPKTCKIHNFIAELEIWHKLRNNQWFYSLSYPTQLSIVCDDKSTRVEQISQIGLFELNPKCKAFTKTVILEVQGQIGISELMNILPFTDINEDDCCKNLKKNLTRSSKIRTIKIEQFRS
ncbi:uncharacterized protein LOC123321989 [Coccinella septempunctata]|uniref:uncharacterized protein LOC123321989 n=1 Tax=Coccinella septempunctata TaxID=41139 RepID=UPI001D060486|nr:uncharacterized protein LOC123321989 [Coccinella septempunctata]